LWGIVIIALVLLFVNWPARVQETPDEWWHLTIDLHAQMDRLGNKPDRDFVRGMVNKLAIDTTVIPTQAEQFWLLSIKAELSKRRVR
jgi:hypothetical protein